MEEIIAKFIEMGLLVWQYAGNEDMKKNMYHDMLRNDIMDFVSVSSCQTLEQTINQAQEQEIELQFWKKRNPPQVHTTVVQAKNSKTNDLWSGGQ